MFHGHQRYLFLVFFIFIATPLIFGLVAPEAAMIVEKEKRPPNALPAWPSSFHELSELTPKLDAYLGDQFGLRNEMIRLYANLNRRILRDGNKSVVVGSDDRMFFRGDDMVLQSAGIIRRDQEINDTIKFIVEMRDLLDKKGIKFLVASPPNSASIYSADLPGWLRNNGKPTEYDLFMTGLRRYNVNVVDLRAALRQAKFLGNLFSLHDSHWTPLGSIVGFNSIAAASGHPDWKIDVRSSLLSPVQRRGGDLARMIGVEDDVTEAIRNVSLSENPQIRLSDGPHAGFWEAGNGSGETLLILGDSFTRSFFPPLLVSNVGKLVWRHHGGCSFDWALIDQVHPNEVWWMPTERLLVCLHRPEHFPG